MVTRNWMALCYATSGGSSSPSMAFNGVLGRIRRKPATDVTSHFRFRPADGRQRDISLGRIAMSRRSLASGGSRSARQTDDNEISVSVVSRCHDNEISVSVVIWGLRICGGRKGGLGEPPQTSEAQLVYAQHWWLLWLLWLVVTRDNRRDWMSGFNGPSRHVDETVVAAACHRTYVR